MAGCFPHGHISKFCARSYAAQHQATAAQVSPPDEFRGETQPFTKNFQERPQVFRRRNASEQYDLAFGAGRLGQNASVPNERFAIAGVGKIDISSRNLP